MTIMTSSKSPQPSPNWIKPIFQLLKEHSIFLKPLYKCLMRGCYVSVNSNWVHLPRQPPRISSKNLPGGRDLTFESCPGAGNSTRIGILWKMKVKLQKNSVNQIFTGENKKQAEVLTFRGLRVFSMEFFLVYRSIFWFCYHTYLTKKSEELPLACLYLKFSLGYCYPHLLLYKRL